MPFAQGWHQRDELIPLPLIEELAELGVFGLTIPEEHGGLGMGKEAMCVVTEELSRGYIGVGSLGTRSEIAAELIRLGGTDEQKAPLPAEARLGRDPADRRLHRAQHRLRPRLAHDACGLAGRLLARHRRQELDHPRRARRPDDAPGPHRPGREGLPRPLDAAGREAARHRRRPVPGRRPDRRRDPGPRLPRHEGVHALLRRLRVPEANLLGGVPGQGFKQLMATFESARIQTAARAIGVAPGALELGLRYAAERQQFGKPLFAFPRVHQQAGHGWRSRSCWPASSPSSPRARRTPAAAATSRPAWPSCCGARSPGRPPTTPCRSTAATATRCEYPISRVLCDARILNIFEGAAEIQAQVIARRLLEG